MKIEVDRKGVIKIKEVYSDTVIETNKGNQLAICFRDDTVEMSVVGSDKWFRADMKTGEILGGVKLSASEAVCGFTSCVTGSTFLPSEEWYNKIVSVLTKAGVSHRNCRESATTFMNDNEGADNEQLDKNLKTYLNDFARFNEKREWIAYVPERAHVKGLDTAKEKIKGEAKFKKPPLGLRPKYISDACRMEEIKAAICRSEDGEIIEVAWLEEYLNLAQQNIG